MALIFEGNDSPDGGLQFPGIVLPTETPEPDLTDYVALAINQSGATTQPDPNGDFIDLFITDDDLTLDLAVQPYFVSGRASIAQDVKHLVRESGLLIEIIGQRNREAVQLNLGRIETLIENDVRIVPGTARVTRTDVETVFIVATTEKYGHLEVAL